MTDAMAHRGPDGRGTHRAPGIGLGHRRLSIIDLEGGAQPLFGADPRLAIVFNGEAYNYQEVRASLPGPWRTKSDTEVFLRAYETAGLSGVARMTGMWGAAIWDARERELVVIRDRLGKKPVYYVQLSGGGYAFASEIRALLIEPEVRREIDPESLDQLLTYRYVPGPRTMFRGIQKLLPGHAAFVSEAGIRFKRYWNPIPKPRRFTDREAEEAFGAAFDRSVALRMVSDVPVGIFLSGGIDSAAVLQAMNRGGVHCFTVAFTGGEEDDEIPYAAETARLFGGQHHTLRIGAEDYSDYLDEYARQLEEPVLNDSAMATHFLSKLARRTVKVVLSGQGADEPLAGYDRYKGELLSPALRKLPFSERLLQLMSRIGASEKLKRAARSLHEPDDVRRALRIYAVVQEEHKRGLLRSELAASGDVAEPLRRLHAEVPELSPLGRMLYTDTRMWLADDLLLVADKLSMAHGLELRTPFLDHRLIELIESMPDDQKLRLTWRGLLTKRVHRAEMAKRLPAAILGRKKRGFDNPLDRWLRRDLKSLVEERLIARGAPIHDYLRPEGIQALVREHASGNEDRRRQLFLLLTLDAWMRAFLGPPERRSGAETLPSVAHTFPPIGEAPRADSKP